MPAEGSGKAIAGPATVASARRNEDERVVAEVPNHRTHIRVGKPTRIVVGSMRSKATPSFRARVAASCGPGTGSFGGTGGGVGGGYGGGGGGGGGFGGNGGPGAVSQASAGNFYSPELSTDFLELPQSLNEQWNYYRFFYNNEPFVGQAIDLHTELPLSKVRLARPKAKSRALADASLRFCEKWVERIGLLQRLLEIVHDYFLIGEVNIFCEDGNPEMPREIREKVVRRVESDGTLTEEWVERDEADDLTVDWLKKNYRGFTNIRVLPPEQVHLQTFPFTDEVILELIPDAKTKHVLEMAEQGDRNAQRVVESMDPVVVEALRRGDNIPLSTNPDGGSFVHYMANKKSQYEPRGHSILQRCLRTLVYFDKLRQAQTSIASRHMTPVRLVYAEDMSESDTENLRDQIDLALQDPDYSIVTNFQVTWEEMNSNGRLLELTGEYDLIARQLYAGLGVTETLLNGESSYSGDRINLEVINTRYMLLRENVQRLVEQFFFKPMCRRMGFVEEDEDGEMVVIYPKLSFTRLALRDNQDTFDALFQLYQKGSLDIETILDLLNIDPVVVKERLERDFATFNDAQFNEVLRSVYGRSGDQLAENSNIVDKIAERLGLEYSKPEEPGMGRFASLRTASSKDGGIPDDVVAKIADAVVERLMGTQKKDEDE
jgi:hypothetical protein